MDLVVILGKQGLFKALFSIFYDFFFVCLDILYSLAQFSDFPQFNYQFGRIIGGVKIIGLSRFVANHIK